MSKVYIIVYDGANVLIGQGGNSGNPSTARQGYHLPGGTYFTGTAEDAAIRELLEETGIKEEAIRIEHNNITSDQTRGVIFVLARTESVEGLVAGFVRPPVKNPHDEPFRSIISVSAENLADNDNFSAKFCTDWFAHGLRAAQDLMKQK